MTAVLGMEYARKFIENMMEEPRLNHPEGVCVDTEGNLWCGGEEGEIYRIDPTGTTLELLGRTGGFALGVAIDSRGFVYVCDAKYACVFRFHSNTKELIRFADGDGDQKMVCPNYVVIDETRGCLYVSDTRECGPGVWRYSLQSGKGALWFGGDCIYANGMSLSPDGTDLYVVESFACKVSRIPIQQDGSAGLKSDVVVIPDVIPDGLAFDSGGRLYISCYEPSAIYRYHDRKLELLIHDKQCTVLAHPTNVAFRGESELFCANLGRWHISLITIPDWAS